MNSKFDYTTIKECYKAFLNRKNGYLNTGKGSLVSLEWCSCECCYIVKHYKAK